QFAIAQQPNFVSVALPALMAAPVLETTAKGSDAPALSISPEASGNAPDAEGGITVPPKPEASREIIHKDTDATENTLPGDGTELIQLDSSTPLLHADERPPKSDLISSALRDVPPANDGTAGAEEMLPMKDTIEMDKSAELAVKKLPGLESLPEIPAARVRSIEKVDDQRDAQPEPVIAAPAFTATASSGGTIAKEQAAPLSDSSAVDRVARAIMDGVARVRFNGNDSASITIKPDASTQLVLRIEMRDGAMSAQLHFAQGDRAGLEQHWDELQRKLADQGVRLSRSDDSHFQNGAQFSDSQRRGFTAPSEPGTFTYPSTSKSISTAEVITRNRARGFETWA
ncbi:MAG TPA: hypothetical protein VK530_21000, partial [Candidatus Acidoferrum sp.]|nr:hypothetical protein [Candidatus Acidoferrum sp.]